MWKNMKFMLIFVVPTPPDEIEEKSLTTSPLKTTAQAVASFVRTLNVFLASQDALEVMRVTHSLTDLLTYLLTSPLKILANQNSKLS